MKYAVYHAALALLARVNIKSKNHAATICAVIKYYFHKERKLDENHIRTLQQLTEADISKLVETKDMRERASYSVSTEFESRLAQIAKRDAVDFTNKVKEILGSAK